MNEKTDNQEGNNITREHIRDAIALLSKIETQLDSIERSSEGATTSLRKKESDDDDGGGLFSKHNWRSFLPDAAANTFAVVVALLVGWYLIEPRLQIERHVAAPVLSVEYAYFSEIGSIKKEPISKLIYQLTQFEQYNRFVMQSMGRYDLRYIDAMAEEIGTGDVEKLSDIVSRYREFLSEKKNELSKLITAIPAMSKSELRMQGRAALEGISGLDEGEIRAALIGQLRKNEEEIDRFLVVLDSLGSLLGRVDSRVFVKLSILNTGVRAGLVRPRGYIQYSDACYTMKRVDSPPQDEQPNAVPTYVVNSDTSGAIRTVGKIDSDTMAQYWFEVLKPVKEHESCKGLPEVLEKSKIASDLHPTICAEGKKALVYLFDHEEEVMHDIVTCSGPIL